MRSYLTAIAILFVGTGPVGAEVLSSGPDHYHLQHEAETSLAPDDLWKRLIHPSEWWDPDHTFSGDANNLKLDARGGGLWLEEWDDGSVAHGKVMSATQGQQLILDAPFGPLQQMAVKTVWIISIAPTETGSKVTFTERSNGAPSSKLNEIAPAVDFVKQNAIERLTKED